MSLYLQDGAANQRACIPAMAQGRTHGAAKGEETHRRRRTLCRGSCRKRGVVWCQCCQLCAAHPPVFGAIVPELLMKVVSEGAAELLLKGLVVVVGCEVAQRPTRLLLHSPPPPVPNTLHRLLDAPRTRYPQHAVVVGCEVAQRPTRLLRHTRRWSVPAQSRCCWRWSVPMCHTMCSSCCWRW